LLDKLKFWKKEPGLLPGGLPLESGISMPPEPAFTSPSIPGIGSAPMMRGLEPEFGSHNVKPSLVPEAFSQPQQSEQLINAKLDTIKAELDNILQRLERIEKLAQAEEAPAPKWR
jgi:hypothetical protein